MKRLNRREFGTLCAVTASPSLAAGVGIRQEPSGNLLVRSNPHLTIGVDLDRKRGFVEELSTKEMWEWTFDNLEGASQDMVLAAGGSLSDVTDRLEPVSVESVEDLENGFRMQCRKPWGSFWCSVRLEPHRPEVLFSVEPDLRRPFEMGAIRFPGALRPSGTRDPVLLDTVTGGRLHRRPGGPFTIPADNSWMRFHAALGRKSSVLAVLEPAFDAALELRSNERSEWGLSWLQLPRLGEIDTNRTQRCVFLPGRSYVPVAREYRRYAKNIGLYRSLEEKLAECPSLERLFGATLIMLGYLHDDEADYAAAFRKLKAMGIDKAYVYPTGYYNLNGGNELYPGYPWIDLDAATRAQLDELGYLHAPWLWLNEILGSSPYSSDALTLQTATGARSRHWKIGELEWYWSHEGRVLEILEQDAPKLREKYSAAHFDVLTAGLVQENYGTWPYDRATNAEFRNAMFRLFSSHDRVVGCEQSKDWAIPYRHFGTNKRPGPFGAEADHWPVPLWQLAFHDAVMTSWWEHSTYNDPALGHDLSGKEIRHRMLLDLLTGDLPSVCPVGKMYGWKKPGDPQREIFVYRYDIEDPVTEEAIQAAAEVGRFNSRHATDDLVHHEFLSEDGREQQTVFASGTRVRIRLPVEGDALDRGELEIL